nr:glycerophosphoryl diester phosphodiesterase membrane domain-containing protein [Alcaligenaceae bacterium]
MNENKWILRGRVLWLYIKYQIASKLLVGLFAFPIFSMISDFLIKASGRTNISSGDYLGFVFSLYGVPVILLGMLLLIFILGMDINTFVIISSLVEENKLKIRMKNILLTAFKSLKHFFSLIGIFLVSFIAFVLPIIGLGISMGPLKNFKIPNFITSVIFGNPLYNTLYYVTLMILIVISVIYIFTVHFILIDGQSMVDAMRSSRKLIFKYWQYFIKDYILKIIPLALICSGVILATTLILILLSYLFSFVYADIHFNAILLILSIVELISFFAFISVPIIISILITLFYKYNKLEGKNIHLQLDTKSEKLSKDDTYRKIKLRTKAEVLSLIIMVIVVNFSVSIFATTYFDDVFKTKVNVELV